MIQTLVLHALEDARYEGPGLPGRSIRELASLLDETEVRVRQAVRQLDRDGVVRLIGTEAVGGAPIYGAISKHDDDFPADPFALGRERYLARKHTDLPNLTRHQDLLREYGDVVTMLRAGEW